VNIPHHFFFPFHIFNFQTLIDRRPKAIFEVFDLHCPGHFIAMVPAIVPTKHFCIKKKTLHDEEVFAPTIAPVSPEFSPTGSHVR
jgi:hypothetical protein